MVNIFPFKGTLYNNKKVKKLDRVTTPPYDVISPAEQDDYYENSNFNIIRLILGKEFKGDSQYNNKYLRAAAFLKGWLQHEILKEDEKPALYFYEQRFKVKGEKSVRQGFIAMLRLEDLDRGRVFPHENTLSKPKLDRVELLRACSANLENIFTIYSDEKLKTLKPFKKFLRRKPTAEAKDKNKVLHRIWRIDSKPVILKVMKEMQDRPVFIADGHHRYEASLNYRKEMRLRNTRFSEDESYNHIMAFFTPIEGEGLVIFPIHRAVKVPPNFDFQRFYEELGIYFEIEEFRFSKRSEKKIRKNLLKELLERGDKNQTAFLLAIKEQSRYLLISLREGISIDELLPEEKSGAYKKLDVTLLHAIVMQKILNVSPDEGISFIKDADLALDTVLKRETDLVFILNPTRIKDVIEIARAFEKMPQKSTFFYPKLLSGLVLNRIAYNEKIYFDEKSD